MEEPQPASGRPTDRSERTGAVLRALRQGLGERLEGGPKRAADLEAEIQHRIMSVADEIARERAAEAFASLETYQQQIEQLQATLAEKEAALSELEQHAGPEQGDAQLRTVLQQTRRRLLELQQESQDCQDLEEKTSNLERQLAEQSQLVAELKSKCAATTAELEEARTRAEGDAPSQAAQIQRLETELAEATQKCASLEKDLNARSEQSDCFPEELAAVEARWQHALDATSAKVATLQEELAQAQQSVAEHDESCKRTRAEKESLEAELTKLRSELERLQAGSTTDELRLREELQAAERAAAAASEERDSLAEELSCLRKEFDQSRQQQEDELQRLQDEIVVTRRDLDEAVEQRSDLTFERDALATEIEGLREEYGDAEAQAASEMEHLRAEVANLRRELEQSRAASSADESQLREQLVAAQHQENEIRAERDSVAAELQTLQQTLEEVLDREQSESRHWQSEREEIQQQVEDAQHRLDGLGAEHAALSEERDGLKHELESLRRELEEQQEKATSDCDSLREEVASAEARLAQLTADNETTAAERNQLSQQLQEVEGERAELAERLQAAEAQVQEFHEGGDVQGELEQTRRKFELALADAQKLKRSNAELEEELARRPEIDQHESAELVSLRVERDALAARVAELEAKPVGENEEELEEQYADLQRRFELAVEDLRAFKQENAELKEKLSAAPQSATTGDASGSPMDWQAQKARLLAALESEDFDGEPTVERQEERARIEGTIEITDRVVADKDREIAELRAQLRESSPSEATPEQEVTEILDKDELIQSERAKLEQLQSEWREKLRTAELEMSVQRAALARKEAELENKFAEIKEHAVRDEVTHEGKPRRRWLSALGLRDDESDDS